MKKLIFLCAASVMFSMSIFAIPAPGAAEKILKLFHREYPAIDKPVFYDFGNSYVVYYEENDHCSGRVYYDIDGEIQKTIKYYSESELDPFIRSKIGRKYKGKAIFGVTEFLSDDEHFYRIILHDDHAWYTIKADPTGTMSLVTKLKKA